MAEKLLPKRLWISRIIALVFGLSLMMFSVDAFLGDASTAKQLGVFLYNSLPTFITLAMVFLTWRKPKYAGIYFLLFALGAAVYFLITGFDEPAVTVYLLLGPLLLSITYFLCERFRKNAVG